MKSFVIGALVSVVAFAARQDYMDDLTAEADEYTEAVETDNVIEEKELIEETEDIGTMDVVEQTQTTEVSGGGEYLGTSDYTEETTVFEDEGNYDVDGNLIVINEDMSTYYFSAAAYVDFAEELVSSAATNMMGDIMAHAEMQFGLMPEVCADGKACRQELTETFYEELQESWD